MSYTSSRFTNSVQAVGDSRRSLSWFSIPMLAAALLAPGAALAQDAGTPGLRNMVIGADRTAAPYDWAVSTLYSSDPASKVEAIIVYSELMDHGVNPVVQPRVGGRRVAAASSEGYWTTDVFNRYSTYTSRTFTVAPSWGDGQLAFDVSGGQDRDGNAVVRTLTNEDGLGYGHATLIVDNTAPHASRFGLLPGAPRELAVGDTVRMEAVFTERMTETDPVITMSVGDTTIHDGPLSGSWTLRNGASVFTSRPLTVGRNSDDSADLDWGDGSLNLVLHRTVRDLAGNMMQGTIYTFNAATVRAPRRIIVPAERVSVSITLPATPVTPAASGEETGDPAGSSETNSETTEESTTGLVIIRTGGVSTEEVAPVVQPTIYVDNQAETQTTPRPASLHREGRAIAAGRTGMLVDAIRQRTDVRPGDRQARGFTAASAAPGSLDDLVRSFNTDVLAPTANGGSSVALWTDGAVRVIEGDASSGASAYDGTIRGASAGIEWMPSGNALIGTAVGFSSAKLDTATGSYEEGMISVSPYAAWWVTPDTTLWTTAGIGFGDASSTRSALSADADTGLLFAAGGVRRDIRTRGKTPADVGFGASLLVAHKNVDSLAYADDVTVAKSATDIVRLNGDVSVSVPMAVGDLTVRPFARLTSVHDLADTIGGDNHALDISAGLRADRGTWNGSVYGTGEVLRDGQRFWGVSAAMRISPDAGGRGTFLALSGSHDVVLDGGDAARSGLTMEAGHGIAIRGGTLTPFTEASRWNTGHAIGSGLRLRNSDESVAVSLEAGREENDNTAAENTVMLSLDVQF